MRVAHAASVVRLACIVLAAWPFGCGGKVDDREWTGVVTDSAGVTLVSNSDTPLWRDGEAWRVEEELDVGAPTDGPEAQFGRIAGIDVDPDGGIYVLDAQAQAVKVFDAEGRFVRAIGGPGAGPGEIGPGAGAVFVRSPDTTMVMDVRNLRVNFYDGAGRSTGELAIDPRRGEPLEWGLASDGRIVVRFRRGREPRAGGEMVFALGPDGSVADTLLVFPWDADAEGTGPVPTGVVVFGPEPVWDLPRSGGTYSALTSDYRISVYGPDGRLMRIVSKAHEKQEVGNGEKDRIFRSAREELEATGAPPAFIAQMLTGFGVADFYPALAAIRSGPWGSLLVQRILPAAELSRVSGRTLAADRGVIGSGEWDVFDSDGRYLGVMELPRRFTPLAFRGERIYGVWRDELDVEHVKRLRIVRSGS